MQKTQSSLFDYPLPPGVIAQEPVSPRDHSKLLMCSRNNENFTFEHRKFYDLDALLSAHDVLVFNDAKVLPVRLLGRRLLDGGEKGGAVELLLTRRISENEYFALTKLSATPKPGMRFVFDPELLATVVTCEREVRIRFEIKNIEPWLMQYGHVPLPPYVDRSDNRNDVATYQTVYAKTPGSSAAPTAGFHFTPELLERIHQKGISTGMVTLHVGVGTFRPIKADTLEEHEMHEEYYEISEEFAEWFRVAREQKKNIIAVGTTVVRTLESWIRLCDERGITPGSRESTGTFSTKIFIQPGFDFQAIDALITNFHLPRSTLLVLIAAMMGLDNTLEAYKVALENHYRFFSYGDAMFIRSFRSLK